MVVPHYLIDFDKEHVLVIHPESGGDDFDATEWPFFWLTQATGLYLHRLDSGLKRVGLDVSRWRVLMSVPPGEARSVTDIAELAIVKLPTMMKLIRRMEIDGLVRCETRSSDGRVTDVSLTQAGLEARQRAWRVAGKIYSNVFAGEREIDLSQLNHLLQLLVGQLREAV